MESKGWCILRHYGLEVARFRERRRLWMERIAKHRILAVGPDWSIWEALRRRKNVWRFDCWHGRLGGGVYILLLSH